MNEELKEEIKSDVKSLFENTIESILESKKKAYESEDDKNDEGDEGVGESKDDKDDKDGDDEEDEDEDRLVESWKVSAYSHATKKTDNITVQNIRDLNRMAKMGTYDYFTVTRPDGQEEEYSVDERTRKLILM